jgi:hypothetical protein
MASCTPRRENTDFHKDVSMVAGTSITLIVKNPNSKKTSIEMISLKSLSSLKRSMKFRVFAFVRKFTFSCGL